MTPSEFKAWFEGYSEAINGAPTAEQFAKVRAKVQQIEDRPKPTLRENGPAPRGWPGVLGQPHDEPPTRITFYDDAAKARVEGATVAEQAAKLAAA